MSVSLCGGVVLVLVRFLALLLCAPLASVSGCPPHDLIQLKQCLDPISKPALPSSHTCSTITTFIRCVGKKQHVCADFILRTKVLDIAVDLKQRHCDPTSTMAPSTSTTTPPPSVHDMFHKCRGHFKAGSHKTLREACRAASGFLECGQSVLWSHDFSLDTYQLHAELLRNRAVYWQHCAMAALFRGGVGLGLCPFDVTVRLASCLNVTYWQPVAAGDIKTFCRVVVDLVPCLGELANGCQQVPILQTIADFLWSSFSLMHGQCGQLDPIHNDLVNEYGDYDMDTPEVSAPEPWTSTPTTLNPKAEKPRPSIQPPDPHKPTPPNSDHPEPEVSKSKGSKLVQGRDDSRKLLKEKPSSPPQPDEAEMSKSEDADSAHGLEKIDNKGKNSIDNHEKGTDKDDKASEKDRILFDKERSSEKDENSTHKDGNSSDKDRNSMGAVSSSKANNAIKDPNQNPKSDPTSKSEPGSSADCYNKSDQGLGEDQGKKSKISPKRKPSKKGDSQPCNSSQSIDVDNIQKNKAKAGKGKMAKKKPDKHRKREKEQGKRIKDQPERSSPKAPRQTVRSTYSRRTSPMMSASNVISATTLEIITMNLENITMALESLLTTGMPSRLPAKESSFFKQTNSKSTGIYSSANPNQTTENTTAGIDVKLDNEQNGAWNDSELENDDEEDPLAKKLYNQTVTTSWQDQVENPENVSATDESTSTVYFSNLLEQENTTMWGEEAQDYGNNQSTIRENRDSANSTILIMNSTIISPETTTFNVSFQNSDNIHNISSETLTTINVQPSKAGYSTESQGTVVPVEEASEQKEIEVGLRIGQDVEKAADHSQANPERVGLVSTLPEPSASDSPYTATVTSQTSEYNMNRKDHQSLSRKEVYQGQKQFSQRMTMFPGEQPFSQRLTMSLSTERAVEESETQQVQGQKIVEQEVQEAKEQELLGEEGTDSPEAVQEVLEEKGAELKGEEGTDSPEADQELHVAIGQKIQGEEGTDSPEAEQELHVAIGQKIQGEERTDSPQTEAIKLPELTERPEVDEQEKAEVEQELQEAKRQEIQGEEGTDSPKVEAKKILEVTERPEVEEQKIAESEQELHEDIGKKIQGEEETNSPEAEATKLPEVTERPEVEEQEIAEAEQELHEEAKGQEIHREDGTDSPEVEATKLPEVTERPEAEEQEIAEAEQELQEAKGQETQEEEATNSTEAEATKLPEVTERPGVEEQETVEAEQELHEAKGPEIQREERTDSPEAEATELPEVTERQEAGREQRGRGEKEAVTKGESFRIMPWGENCSHPWAGHRWCTNIMMYARLANPHLVCRSLYNYLVCLRELLEACRGFAPFQTIITTLDYVGSVFHYKCPGYRQSAEQDETSSPFFSSSSSSPFSSTFSSTSSSSFSSSSSGAPLSP